MANDNENLVINQLLDNFFQNDQKKKHELLESPDKIRELGLFGDKDFSSDEILEIDINSLERIKKLLEEGKNDEVIASLKEFDFDTISYLVTLAKKRKIADIAYRLLIGNLKVDKELNTELGMIDYKYTKKLGLKPIDTK